MKKLFLLFTTLCLAFGIGFSVNSYAPILAETETSEQTNESQTSEEEHESEENVDETSENNGSSEELEPINVNEEISKLSQTAKDVIEVIKTVFNQPIVIGGVSVTLGAIIVWILGKVFANVLSKRNSKYDKKIKELLEKIGVDKELIDELTKEYESLKEDYDKMEEAIKEIIANTKNIKVKEKLENIYKEDKKEVLEIVEEVKEQNNVPETTKDKIKEILGK